MYSIGLGIDAGGTFTDAVLFDFKEKRVLGKSKARTTHWRYSEGIMEAVNAFLPEDLNKIDIVSISTTLVTNAIVESKIQPVGLLIMPSGINGTSSFIHNPSRIIKGRVSIEGEIREPVSPDEVRAVVNRFVAVNKVRAFAVSGYGGSVNPELELEVKDIIREETGMDVCCGHELSGTLNFYIRAHTAVLNAGTIPVMEKFLQEMKGALEDIGINTPVAVVRGDGSVMSYRSALEFPLQTALSGPAASMAGARFLTGRSDALVVDVGGTTSDIGFLEKGVVDVCNEGAQIGTWKTHVKAVDMLTAGLGGDSEIVFDRVSWLVGPGRIVPFCFMATLYNYSELLSQAVIKAEEGWDTTRVFQWLYLSGKDPDFPITIQETRIIETLKNGPVLISDLSDSIGAGDWKLIRSERLEQSGTVLRAGLTPTDLYHSEGRLDLWNTSGAFDYFEFIAGCAEIKPGDLMETLRESIGTKLGGSFFSRIFPDIADHGGLIASFLNMGNRHMFLRSELKSPVIGLGASASLMLSDIVGKLNGELVLTDHGDVANAVGAVISRVEVSMQISIFPTPEQTFRAVGMGKGIIIFETLEESEITCLEYLKEKIIVLARKLGTSEEKMSIHSNTRTALDVAGKEVFLERILTGTITGIPDLI